jgi:hypothetical protein
MILAFNVGANFEKAKKKKTKMTSINCQIINPIKKMATIHDKGYVLN